MNKCEWCGMEYPEEDKTFKYYELYLFSKEHHIICRDCLIHLKQIKYLEKK